MTSSSYFRFPHLHGDLVTFVAEDDVWIAPLGGGRAWRVSALQLPARNPRFTPDGKRLVWTVVQGTAPEVVTADVDGGGYRQLSYFGHASTKVKGFTPDGDVLVTSAFRQADSRHTHAYSLPVAGGWATELPLGPVESVAFGPVVGDERPVVLASVLSREPAWWKRYRGGAAGKLWIDRDGNGEFERLAAGAGRQPDRPDVGRRTDRLPLRPRGLRQPLLRAAQRLGPAPPHGPRGLLRPPRRHRRPARRLRIRRRAVAAAGPRLGRRQTRDFAGIGLPGPPRRRR